MSETAVGSNSFKSVIALWADAKHNSNFILENMVENCRELIQAKAQIWIRAVKFEKPQQYSADADCMLTPTNRGQNTSFLPMMNVPLLWRPQLMPIFHQQILDLIAKCDREYLHLNLHPINRSIDFVTHQ